MEIAALIGALVAVMGGLVAVFVGMNSSCKAREKKDGDGD